MKRGELMHDTSQPALERYYELLETKGNEFRGRAGDYLFLASINRKNDAERIRQRNAIIAKDKYDRDIYGASLRKRIRRDDPVFAPLALFANLPDGEFAAKAGEVMPQVLTPAMLSERAGRS